MEIKTRMSQTNQELTKSSNLTSKINNGRYDILSQQIKYKCFHQKVCLKGPPIKVREEMSNFHTMTSILHEIFFETEIHSNIYYSHAMERFYVFTRSGARYKVTNYKNGFVFL